MLRSFAVPSSLPDQLSRAAYLAQRSSVFFPFAAAHVALRRVGFEKGNRVPPREAHAALWQRARDLVDRDLANVRDGVYPRAMLFDMPVAGYLRQAPSFVREIQRSLRRKAADDWKDLPSDVDLARYPAYFRRNFHWQSDGYLSRRSAEVYDLSVEFLFLGLADVMRRQILPPIVRHARERGEGLQLLDVACGTGAALRMIARARPDLRLTGLDLSPYYLQVARERLADVADLSLVAENAEDMPFRDGRFDVVTSVYLFHELPRNARRRVLAECFRVLRPGGLLVLEDSAQLSESAELAFFLGRFDDEFHEPFYRDYLRDDLAQAAEEAGFEVSAVERHWLSKVVVARRPSHAA